LWPGSVHPLTIRCGGSWMLWIWTGKFLHPNSLTGI
jgi:hypothetical protein